MPRDFTIYNDSSWASGSVGGNTIFRPFIQHVSSIPSLKNTNTPYKLFLGDKLSAEKESIVDNIQSTDETYVYYEQKFKEARASESNNIPRKNNNNLATKLIIPSDIKININIKNLTLNSNLPLGIKKGIK